VLSVNALNKIEIKEPEQKCPTQTETAAQSAPLIPATTPATVAAPTAGQAEPNKPDSNNETADKAAGNADVRPDANDKK
jgi:hypothetical protein